MSKVLLAKEVFPLPEAQQPTDPFAFGGMKVVPRGDRVFGQDDEMWYFFELRRPGTTEPPAISLRVEVEGETNARKRVKMSAPWKAADALPLKGVPGHFAVGSAIPMKTVQPGQYRIRLQIRDTASGTVTTREETFRVVP